MDVPNSTTYLVWIHLYLSGMWLVVMPRMTTKKTKAYSKEIRLRVQNTSTILNTVITSYNWETYMTT